MLNECEKKLKVNENNLLIEIKEFLQQSEIKWSISSNHIKFLCEHLKKSFHSFIYVLKLNFYLLVSKVNLYLNHLKETNHLEIVLKVFQTISLNKSLAETTALTEIFVKEFLPRVKKNETGLQINSLRTVSN